MLDRPIFVIGIPDEISFDLICLLVQHSQCGPKVIEQRRQRHDEKRPHLTPFDLWREEMQKNTRMRDDYRRRMRIPDILWGGDKQNRQYIENILMQHRPSIQGFHEPRLVCNLPPVPHGDYSAFSGVDLSPIWQVIQSPATRAVIVIDHDKQTDPFVIEAKKRGAHIITQRLIEQYPFKAMEIVLEWCDLKKEEYIYHLGGKDQPRTDVSIMDSGYKEPIKASEAIDIDNVDADKEVPDIPAYADEDTRKRIKDMSKTEVKEVLDLPSDELPGETMRTLAKDEKAVLPQLGPLPEWIAYATEQGVDVSDIDEAAWEFPTMLKFVSQWRSFCEKHGIDVSDIDGDGAVRRIKDRARKKLADETELYINVVQQRLLEAMAIGKE